MISQYAFFFDAQACAGCKACQMACKDRNDLQTGLLWRRVYEVTAGRWEKKGGVWVPDVAAYNISMSCNHCENPVCAAACPVKAVGKRDDGIVFIETPRCIGCRYCEWSCPYTAIRFDAASNTVSKCDFCVDLVEAGEPPACVAACPARALAFGDLVDLEKKYGNVRRIFPLPDPETARPAIIIRPHRDEAKAAAGGGEVANWEEV